MSKPIIIFGSSRSQGYTRAAIESVLEDKPIPLIDLNTLNIAPYDYDHRHQHDDYLPLMVQILEHDLMVIATPVYWYTMSAVMKIFFDRLSDLLVFRQDLGRQLCGKKMFVLASFGVNIPRGFEDAFEQTCEYMGMQYVGCSFIYSGEDVALKENNVIEIEKARRVFFAYPTIESSGG